MCQGISEAQYQAAMAQLEKLKQKDEAGQFKMPRGEKNNGFASTE
jgi:hypothetical protein